LRVLRVLLVLGVALLVGVHVVGEVHRRELTPFAAQHFSLLIGGHLATLAAYQFVRRGLTGDELTSCAVLYNGRMRLLRLLFFLFFFGFWEFFVCLNFI
jgi:hypothetical protein